MKKIVFSVMGSVMLVGIIIALWIIPKPKSTPVQTVENNVSIQNGVQYISILAKAGYSPRATTAQAGIPTVIRVTTNNTYDCSLGLSIPSIRYRKNLKPTGEEDIQLGSLATGATVRGVCSMGMYNFSITFN